jgi:RNA polymerase sigma factor (TIGR02999 family)
MTVLEITGIIRMARRGHSGARDHLAGLLDEEFARVLPDKLLKVGPNEWLRPDEVVQEACRDLVRNPGAEPADRAYFYVLAAASLRKLLVQRARDFLEAATQRAPSKKTAPFDRVDQVLDTRAPEIPAIDRALSHLEQTDPRLARIVELRFFAGLSIRTTAEILSSTEAMVQRDWSVACAFIQQWMAPIPELDPPPNEQND